MYLRLLIFRGFLVIMTYKFIEIINMLYEDSQTITEYVLQEKWVFSEFVRLIPANLKLN